MPSVIFLRPRLITWTALSASSPDAGWYGAEVVCFTPFLRRNSSNSRLTKPVPLSVTTISGSPNLAKSDLSSSMTQLEEVEDVQTASIHLECASIATSMFFPSSGPAKSRWSRAHGLVGHFHGFSGASGGDYCVCWHSGQSLTDFSISAEIPGHQTYILASDFIREMPGCPSCNSCGGITILVPHMRHPS